MAVINITVDCGSGVGIQELTDRYMANAKNPGLNRLEVLLGDLQCRKLTGTSVKVTSRDTDPSVATSGSGSTQYTITT